MGSLSDQSEPRYRRRAPAAALLGLITGIYGYEERGDALQGVVETASLDVPLIINFGSSYRIGLGRSPNQNDRYGSFAAGLFAGPVVMDSDGDAQCIQVNFTPVGGRLFFARPMNDLANCMVPLDDLSDPEIDEIAMRLAELNSWDARLDLVERFVAARLARADAIDPAITWAVSALMRSGGQIRIGTIADKLEWSRRRLVERFREELGLPPKAIARIVRFNAARSMAESVSEPDWADIAAACGYADQPHLVREFAELAGASPTAWHQAA
ncbi:MAG: helix-turn-helix domain-containing protein [Rhizobiaceae bacterium]